MTFELCFEQAINFNHQWSNGPSVFGFAPWAQQLAQDAKLKAEEDSAKAAAELKKLRAAAVRRWGGGRSPIFNGTEKGTQVPPQKSWEILCPAIG